MARRATGPSAAVVDAVLERGCYSCELCDSGLGDRRGIDYQIHHRRPRQMGGTLRRDTNLPSNLLLLCLGCHGEIESNRKDAYWRGLLVRQNHDPQRVKVRLYGPRWVYLTVTGGPPGEGYSDRPPKDR